MNEVTTCPPIPPPERRPSQSVSAFRVGAAGQRWVTLAQSRGEERGVVGNVEGRWKMAVKRWQIKVTSGRICVALQRWSFGRA